MALCGALGAAKGPSMGSGETGLCMDQHGLGPGSPAQERFGCAGGVVLLAWAVMKVQHRVGVSGWDFRFGVTMLVTSGDTRQAGMKSVWVGCGQQAVPLGQHSTRGHLDGGRGA